MTPGPHHELVIKIFADGHVIVSVACPHTGTDRPCASWRENEAGEACICICDACAEGDHENCNSGYVEDIGRKWCDARPVDECWYQEAVAQVGWQDMLYFGHDGVEARIPVRLHGGSWEEPIEVDAVTTLTEVTP